MAMPINVNAQKILNMTSGKDLKEVTDILCRNL